MVRIISIITSIFFITISIPITHAADTSMLERLGIMTGDENGDMQQERPVSRAEFTKLAIMTSSYRNSVANSVLISPYADVNSTHWAAAYITLATDQKLMNGYVDGTFRPDNGVTLEEALNVLVRILGYDQTDIGTVWGDGQIALANGLGLLNGIEAQKGQQLTRGDIAQLINNLLDTKPKNQQTKYLLNFELEYVENVLLIATNAQDAGVSSGYVYTSQGLYKIDRDFDMEMVGRRGDILLRNGDELSSFEPYPTTTAEYTVTGFMASDMLLDGSILDMEENMTTYYKSQKLTYKDIVALVKENDVLRLYYDENNALDYAFVVPFRGTPELPLQFKTHTYLVYEIVNENMTLYSDGQYSRQLFDDSTVLYQQDTRYTYGAKKAEINIGDMLTLRYDLNNKVEYIYHEKSEPIIPSIIRNMTWSYQERIDRKTISVFRNGVRCHVDDLRVGDVYYISRPLNTIWAYNNTKTGIYRSATPNQDMPTEVVIGDETYQIETSEAFRQLSSQGGLRFGDLVTVSLGRDGRIADVTVNSEYSVTGFLYEVGQKPFTDTAGNNYSSNYIRIADKQGISREYTTTGDHFYKLNQMVMVTLKVGSAAEVTTVNSEGAVQGTFDWSNRYFGGRVLSPDVSIVDTVFGDTSTQGTFGSIYPQRLHGCRINASNVLYYDTDSQGFITSLFLKDYTGDLYSYGIVKSVTGTGSNKRFVYDLKGSESNCSGGYSVYSGQPARFWLTSNGTVQGINPISKSVSGVSRVSDTHLLSGNSQYPIDDKTVAYEQTYDFQYKMIPLSSLNNMTNSHLITAYYDKEADEGGRVRVIIAKQN